MCIRYIGYWLSTSSSLGAVPGPSVGDHVTPSVSYCSLVWMMVFSSAVGCSHFFGLVTHLVLGLPGPFSAIKFASYNQVFKL